MFSRWSGMAFHSLRAAEEKALKQVCGSGTEDGWGGLAGKKSLEGPGGP